MNIREMLETSTKRFPDETVILFHDQEVAYQTLNLTVNRVANSLVGLGVKKGDRVCLYLHNCPEFVYSHFGIVKIGAISVPINVMYKRQELTHIINDSGANILITSGDKVSHIQEVSRELPQLERLIITSPSSSNLEAIPYRELVEDASPREPEAVVNEGDLASIIYTSGTTGRPKGAMLTHRNFISSIRALADVWRWTNRDRLLLALPMFHVHGLGVVVHGVIYTGGSVVMMERFNPEQALHLISKYRCNVFMGVPTMYVMLLQVSNPHRYDLSHMRLFISGSAPLSPKTFREFKDTYGFEIVERYGLTETVMNISNPYDGLRKPGSVGLPLPGVQVRIVNEDGVDLVEGEVGEILVKGSNVTEGYWNMSEETENVFQDGWFRTGDLGVRDHDGYVSIAGRKKEMIITSGFKVYPREVEELLSAHKKVKEAAVIGVKDELKGEIVKAFIVPEPGEDITVEEIIAYCRSNLAAFKTPRIIELIQDLPRTASGKIAKTALK